MLRRSHILTAVAVLVATAALVPSAYAVYPAGAFAGDGQGPTPQEQAYQDLRSPDTRDAARATLTREYSDLRSPDARDAATAPEPRQYSDLRSPDARDAATAPEPRQYSDLRSPDARDAGRTPVTGVAQDLRSPDARDAGRTPVEVPTPVVEIREVPGSGFDWGDAGIGAAGMLALFSIAAGLALMAGGRKRRGFHVSAS